MASSSTSTNVGNMVVVTHLLPAAATGGQQPSWERGGRFRRGQPKALGTVQIMIGVMVLAFTITMGVVQPSLGFFSGIFVWGAAIYIASGSVTVAAGKHFSRCLINASLVMNIIAAVVAVTGIIIYSLDSVLWNYHHFAYRYYEGYSIVLVVFQLLQLIVSITVAGYTCSETCDCCRESVASVYTGLMQGVGTAEKMFEYLDRKPQHPADGAGLVEFRDVTFAYPTRPDTDVLKGVSFTLRPGRVTALVGPSGSGKSSCVSLLENFYLPQQGQVLLDGKPINTYQHQYLHSKVQQALDSVLQEHTVLVVAHRLSTVEKAHHIVVLDGGRVVEQGSHGQLMAAAGLYCKLVQRQVLGVETDVHVPNESHDPEWDRRRRRRRRRRSSSTGEPEGVARY